MHCDDRFHRDIQARSPRRPASAWLLLCALLCTLGLGGASQAQVEATPEVEAALTRAAELHSQRQYRDAIKAYKKADKLAGAPSYRCCLGLAAAYNQVGAYKDAAASARQATELAGDDYSRARAFNQLGRALFENPQANAGTLGEAEQAFRRTLELDPDSTFTYYNLGLVLLKLERDAEGVGELQKFLERQPQGAESERARSLIDDPRRARIALIPEFDTATLGGDYLTSEDFAGKVLLIDFWGTWCKPCVASIPELRRLHKRFSKDPFLMVSVSNDSDEQVLRSFVAEQQMVWPQVWDRDRRLGGSLFQVTRFPTHLVVDHEGVVVYRGSGWSSRSASDLSRHVGAAVRKAKKALKSAG